MRKTKLIALLVIATLLVALVCCTFVGCDKGDADGGKHTKAIIYVTALFSGGLYDKVTNEAIWEPFAPEINVYDFVDETGAIDFMGVLDYMQESDPEGYSEAISTVMNAISLSPGTVLYDTTLDQDGVSNNPDLVPANDKEGEMDIYYGVFGIYKPFIDDFKARYGSEYDCKMFNYDWRYSPADAGAKLEQFINDNGYEEVILLSHSMGGSTVNSYLARSQANRDKVKLYMGCAPATLGSFDALVVLNSIDAYANNMIAGFGMEGINTVDDLLASFGVTLKLNIDALAHDFIVNNQGLIDLIPSWEFLNSDQYGDGEHGIIIDGNPIDSKEELYNYYKTCEWAYYLDEDGNKIPDSSENASPDGYKLKDVVVNLESYFDSFFIDGEFVSDLVNSYYFVGTGKRGTITGMEYDSATKTYTVKKNYGNAYLGDGTVPAYSSFGGQSLSEIPEGHVVRYDGWDHLNVGCNLELMKEDMYRLIDSVK